MVKKISNIEQRMADMEIQLHKDIYRERDRVNRIVQVLLQNLPAENLNIPALFEGIDCHGNARLFSGTLKEFLTDIVDP